MLVVGAVYMHVCYVRVCCVWYSYGMRLSRSVVYILYIGCVVCVCMVNHHNDQMGNRRVEAGN